LLAIDADNSDALIWFWIKL